MKRIFFALSLTAATVFVGVQLSRRWVEERADKRVALLFDWSECRDLAARQGLSEQDLGSQASEHQFQAAVIPASTLLDLYLQHRVLPIQRPTAIDPWDTQEARFTDIALAETVQKGLSRRGVSDLTIVRIGSNLVLQRQKGSFQLLKDVELGFDPLLIQNLEKFHLWPFLRINQDPWTSLGQGQEMLEDNTFPPNAGVLFNSDDPPGGLDELPFWGSYLRHRHAISALFEFHFSRASLQMARFYPSLSYRAHTIPAIELKDLNSTQELNRWRRAVDERSCRLLLVHTAMNDSWPSYLGRVDRIRTDLVAKGWTLALPKFRPFWVDHLTGEFVFTSFLAFFAAICIPWSTLRMGCNNLERMPQNSKGGCFELFFLMSALTVGCACAMAVLAENPQSRIEVIPFHGIKVAFFLGWAGCIAILYRWPELRHALAKSVRRWDIIIGLSVIALVGYALLRSGNASAGWKPPFEQGLRDRLEAFFGGRPRFKEFALGHPLLLLGLFLQNKFRSGRGGWDARPLIAIGMVGQVSMVNSFCHLHSPLKLIFLRTANGLVLGSLIGFAAIQAASLYVSKKKL